MVARNNDRIEINTGDAILVLDGNVIELFFREAMLTRRWHVCHVSVDAKPSRNGDDMRYTLGTRLADVMVEPLPFNVPMAEQDRVSALFEEAVRRRDASAVTVPS